MLCLTIALVVLGPQRLPEVARRVGRWAGAAKSFIHRISAELESEMNSAELRGHIAEAGQQLRDQVAAVQLGGSHESSTSTRESMREEPTKS